MALFLNMHLQRSCRGVPFEESYNCMGAQHTGGLGADCRASVGCFFRYKDGQTPSFFVLGLIAGLIAAVRDFVALAKLVQKEDNGNG